MPKGNTTVEKVLKISELIFPQLRPELVKYSLGSTRLKSFFKKIFQIFPFSRSEKDFTLKLNQNIKSYLFDAIYHIPDGNFIIKDFKDMTIRADDIKELDNKTCKIKGNIFRILVVGKSYDESLLNRESLEKIMDKMICNIDLIIDEGNSYSVLWTN